MFKQSISFEVWGGEAGKYRLRDSDNQPVENTPEETCDRVSTTLAECEKDKSFWFNEFKKIVGTKFAGGGRIMANIGAKSFKKETSPINCTVMRQIPDSMLGIMEVAKEAAVTLKSGCGVGYDFSTIRPKGSYVFGAGAATSGVVSFMKIFDAVCSTVMSGGGRRGAQMGCLDVASPEIEDFITEKRKDGMLRYFNLSVLITDDFMQSVVEDKDWNLWFWEKSKSKLDVKKSDICLIKKDDIPYAHPEYDYFAFAKDHNEVVFGNCTTKDIFYKKIYKTVKAKEIFDLIMKSTYSFWEPGFILIDRMNRENNLYFCETIRCTNPCSEQPLPPLASCLLGSMILTEYVKNAFEDNCYFDFDAFVYDVKVANRLLDNVVELNNLPLPELQEQIMQKRRHGLGFTGLGSMFHMMKMSYGSKDSQDILDKISFLLAATSLRTNIELAKEKGPAPIFELVKNRKLVLKSGYLSRLIDAMEDKEQIVADILKYGLRFSHATSIAPTGTMSLTWGNNCSNGIEPVFSNSYIRNIRQAHRKTKMQYKIYDYSYFLWKEKYGNAPLPEYWRTTDNLSVNDHLMIQSIAQKWCDSAISKTINVPADYSFEDFKNVYLDGWKLGLKGVTTYKPNAKVSSGVLTDEEELSKNLYTFITEDGEEITLSGIDTVEYDGEEHNVANLFDALKEGIYGNM